MSRRKHSHIKGVNTRTRILLGLLIITLVMVVINLVLVNINASRDQIYIQRTSDLRVLSQSLAQTANEALGGSEQAFVELNRSRDEFEQNWTLINQGESAHVDTGIGLSTALPGRSEAIEQRQPGVDTLWQRVRRNTDILLDNRDVILAINETADDATGQIPVIQQGYEDVVNTLLDNSAPLSTISVAQRQSWLSERIALSLDRIVQGGEPARSALDSFRRDITLFSSNHEALLEGDPAIGVNRVTSTDARRELEAISDAFATIETSANDISAGADELFNAARALEVITEDSEALLGAATGLYQYFTDQQGAHIASPELGYALLLVILVLICLYGLEVIKQSRRSEEMAEEVNKRNNEAIMNLLDEISNLADGDLTVEATVSEEFTGAIADSVNYAVGQLRELVSAITEVTVEVTDSTRTSAKTAEYLTNASERQSRNIMAVSESVREMEQNINRVSDNARRSLEVARNSVGIASGGADVVKNTIQGMDNIRDQIQETSRRIKRLGESSQEIGGFVSLINDIADHTNTLSLNAAIQAAMAGEAGKGFGVVADEVHALAERSGDATRQIENLVRVIQRDINDAVSSMEQTTSQVVEGTRLAQSAGTALDDIQRVSRELAELVEEITDAATNQTRSASDITESMELIQEITTETSSGTQATSDFIRKLGTLTERLENAVSGFSLDKASGSASLHESRSHLKRAGQDTVIPSGGDVVAHPAAGRYETPRSGGIATA